MNLYFLLEGKTEKKVYPKLLSHFSPKLNKVDFADEAKENNYYLVTAGGFPCLFDKALPKAIKEVDECSNFNHLILVLDTDNKKEIREKIEHTRINTVLNSNCRFHIIAQECCLETWFLGNRAVYPNKQSNNNFLNHAQFYNVSQEDPELMLKPDCFTGSISNYHENYLKQMLFTQGINYSKKIPGGVTTTEYIAELKNRINETPHLSSLKNFFSFCESISL